MDTNFSYYTIPIAWALSLAPHVYAVSLHDAKSPKKLDLTLPRGLVASLDQNQSLDKVTKDKIVRAEGAQQNGLENLGIFAAAVVAGNAAGLEPTLLNALAGGYLLSRALYNVVYINNTTATVAYGRTAVFFSGVACCFGLFIAAGNKARQ